MRMGVCQGRLGMRIDGFGVSFQCSVRVCLSEVTFYAAGFETARCLAAHGCHVIMACRDTRKSSDAQRRIQDRHVSTGVCDGGIGEGDICDVSDGDICDGDVSDGDVSDGDVSDGDVQRRLVTLLNLLSNAHC